LQLPDLAISEIRGISDEGLIFRSPDYPITGQPILAAPCSFVSLWSRVGFPITRDDGDSGDLLPLPEHPTPSQFGVGLSQASSQI
jgi:hypothetical protein